MATAQRQPVEAEGDVRDPEDIPDGIPREPLAGPSPGSSPEGEPGRVPMPPAPDGMPGEPAYTLAQVRAALAAAQFNDSAQETLLGKLRAAPPTVPTESSLWKLDVRDLLWRAKHHIVRHTPADVSIAIASEIESALAMPQHCSCARLPSPHPYSPGACTGEVPQ